MIGWLRLAPIVLLVAAVALALWYRGQALSSQMERDRARAELGTALAANRAQEQTIGRLRASAERNDKIVAEMARDLAAISQATSETSAAIADLKDANETVRAYLDTAVPRDLRKLLDK